MSKSSNSGPKGVTVTLYSESDRNSALKTTTTETDGTFYFTPIRPGKYVLIASHPVYVNDKKSFTVYTKSEKLFLKIYFSILGGILKKILSL